MESYLFHTIRIGKPLFVGLIARWWLSQSAESRLHDAVDEKIRGVKEQAAHRFKERTTHMMVHMVHLALLQVTEAIFELLLYNSD